MFFKRDNHLMQVKRIAECSGCRSKVLQNALVAGQKYCRMPHRHSAIYLTCTKLPLVFKTFVLSNFEWPLVAGFTVYQACIELISRAMKSFALLEP